MHISNFGRAPRTLYIIYRIPKRSKRQIKESIAAESIQELTNQINLHRSKKLQTNVYPFIHVYENPNAKETMPRP